MLRDGAKKRAPLILRLSKDSARTDRGEAKRFTFLTETDVKLRNINYIRVAHWIIETEPNSFDGIFWASSMWDQSS